MLLVILDLVLLSYFTSNLGQNMSFKKNNNLKYKSTYSF